MCFGMKKNMCLDEVVTLKQMYVKMIQKKKEMGSLDAAGLLERHM
jgi:hypothetical protein